MSETAAVEAVKQLILFAFGKNFITENITDGSLMEILKKKTQR